MKRFDQIMGDSNQLFKRIAKIKHDVVNDHDVKQFLEQHQAELTNAMIDEDLNVLQEYKDQQKHYDGHSFNDCPNFVKGHVPELYIDNQHIKIRYLPCPCKVKHDEEKYNAQLITSHHMQRDTLNAKLKDIYLKGKRLEVARAADDICNAIANQDANIKGMYLHGEFGTGKSFILGAIANQLKTKKIPSTIIYLPEFIRTLKSGFKDGTFETKLAKVREANILMLDDIGAEEITPWVRDEIIGPILHYRMVQELPTFFSSNYNFKELQHHLSVTRDGTELTKAARIMERIKTLATPYYLDGENYRDV
ncbi:primosomal protein DnaI [Staphylococcus arlettae]|mgnify:CR=1 FL=1|jgi:primosomal protein DnaI|uniref:Primosomal protein DnaI n=2 Tax=Staphylococcus arlettae TaxID=29378 RepID=A0A2T7BX37_9STAP|nr:MULTISPECIES: primosomal protein DnaI [Staphylococcus]EJY95497.1 primosomal protein DnaI [Staphylococcus arlettae CVD059]ERF47853.1 primosomal protein DnaI [Staphylococcus sp. EGD-HP3]KAB2478566.1 primosomal protein DnaI [Staphylococcus sp. CH99b_3]MBK3719542.1 Primosomal protein DnaI [Staphylococcus arlettae]MCD8816663.1 primosomal protein DnaI [Staphylococcus arlettae]